MDPLLPEIIFDKIQTFCVVWYALRKNPIPNALIKLKENFPRLCISQEYTNLNEIWFIDESSCYAKILKDSVDFKTLEE